MHFIINNVNQYYLRAMLEIINIKTKCLLNSLLIALNRHIIDIGIIVSLRDIVSCVFDCIVVSYWLKKYSFQQTFLGFDCLSFYRIFLWGLFGCRLAARSRLPCVGKECILCESCLEDVLNKLQSFDLMKPVNLTG